MHSHYRVLLYYARCIAVVGLMIPERAETKAAIFVPDALQDERARMALGSICLMQADTLVFKPETQEPVPQVCAFLRSHILVWRK